MASERITAAGARQAARPVAAEKPSKGRGIPFGQVRRLFLLGAATFGGVYLLIGLIIVSLFAFLGGGGVGAAAFSQPNVYLIWAFWPYGLWSFINLMVGL